MIVCVPALQHVAGNPALLQSLEQAQRAKRLGLNAAIVLATFVAVAAWPWIWSFVRAIADAAIAPFLAVDRLAVVAARCRIDRIRTWRERHRVWHVRGGGCSQLVDHVGAWRARALQRLRLEVHAWCRRRRPTAVSAR